ncbi:MULTISPECIES: ABC transporter ATP-binding protein [unclassified Nesterenkonia]|uniref:ABC transporter ATP-binding protein n=1 Tax=unclassified Nesterenkonia TaxID=2629769 RepID=UPI001F4C6052|nr:MULTISPECIES: ABC transporter ATP-binding protein [unclassified Nesterenkonia]MCH8561564.1 ABC transporter ATP-binding protein [Nesterenkonia sp. DZ6]MCH8563939.1 ABC transporter ATP-binding protein [Nesterenkonia sp. YGD6]
MTATDIDATDTGITDTDTTMLQVSGVEVRFGDQPVLHDIDLRVKAGTTTAIVGPSGSGKTSLLRVIAGFLAPEHGEVRLHGADVTEVPAHRRSIGLVAQDGALFPHLDVAGNIAFGLPRGTPRRERRRRVAELLELVSLTGDHASRRPDQLSGGQRQRVALARALARQPEMILLDEPFSALDAGLRESTRQAIREILRITGTTTILVTHDQDEALSFADQVAVLKDGRLRQIGAPEEVYTRPCDVETAQFLGDAVLLPGQLTGQLPEPLSGQAGAVWDSSTPLGSVNVELVCPNLAIAHRTASGSTGQVMLRPEQITLSEEGVAGTVLSSQYFGHDTTALVQLEGVESPLRLRQLNAVPLTPGTQVHLAVQGAGVFYPAFTECHACSARPARVSIERRGATLMPSFL